MAAEPRKRDKIKGWMKRAIGKDGQESGADALELVQAAFMTEHDAKIDASNTHLNDSMLSSLAIFLQSRADPHQCSHLSLAENSITDKGCPFLTSVLSHLPKLTTLDLSRNKLKGERAARALAKTIETVSTLRSLTLVGNEFGPNGTPLISEMFKLSPALKSLDLGWISWSRSETGSITAAGTGSQQEETFGSY